MFKRPHLLSRFRSSGLAKRVARRPIAHVQGDKVYDPLTRTYSFACPHGREPRVPLSDFRMLERLPGTSHPAVFEVTFSCTCGSAESSRTCSPDGRMRSTLS